MNPLPLLAGRQKLVFLAALLLLVSWLAAHAAALSAAQDAAIRFGLGAVFAGAIFLRSKPACGSWADASQDKRRDLLATALVLVGFGGALTGIVLRVNQMHWVGLLLVIYACFRWSLPRGWARDSALALLLLYWVHPLPGQLFGPLQFAMQKMSVLGTERFLHALNVRVWADGFALRTAQHTYDVPAACSGMRAATTVFLLALGLGLLRRFVWYELLGLVGIALVQALALNILRIAAMVVFTSPYTRWTTARFVHDTTGIVALLAIILTYVEAAWWDRRRLAGAVPREPNIMRTVILSHLPRPLLEMWRHRRIVGTVTLFLAIPALVAAVTYRDRPAHRAAMIKDVVEGLLERGEVAAAQRAAVGVSELIPTDSEWRLVQIRVRILGGDLEGSLNALAAFIPVNADQQREARILTAYTRLLQGQVEAAEALMSDLPPRARRDPRVAMIVAEVAAIVGQPEEVAANVVTAARRQVNLTRVRALFPYLERARQWQAIADADRTAPYASPEQALAAASAHMNLDHPEAVAGIMREATVAWPDDSRLLVPLFYLTKRAPASDWEAEFTRQFYAAIRKISTPDQLYELFGRCFELARPDLAWALYRRIESIDADYPGLPLAGARYGSLWFTFRNRTLHTPARLESDTVDLAPAAFLAGRAFHVAGSRQAVPLADILTDPDRAHARQQCLDDALARFAKRGADGTLSIPLQFEYAIALSMANRVADALRVLDQIAAAHPDQKSAVRIAVSEIHESRGDWQSVYEVLRGYPDEANPQVTPMVRLCQSALRLRLDLAALATAHKAFELFPQSTRSLGALAVVSRSLDGPETALFMLGRPRLFPDPALDVLEADLLYSTQRYSETESFCDARMLPKPRTGPDLPQSASLPPAEAALAWKEVACPSDQDFAAAARIVARNRAEATSPFVRRLFDLWLNCYGSHCAEGTTDLATWASCGRDRYEQAIALNQLTLLLCWQKQYARAAEPAREATVLLPEAAILWRIQIGLTGGRQDILSAARAACPSDSEIWLAHLVAGIRTRTSAAKAAGRNSNAGEWALEQVRGAADADAVSVAAMTRAGDFLLRQGLTNAAVVTAHDVFARARGMLPAHQLATRCAMVSGNWRWAEKGAIGMLNDSVSPSRPVLEFVARIESELGDADADMIHALKGLRQRDPENPLWPEMLGFARFMRGGWEVVSAAYNMDSALELGSSNVLSFVISAESARQLGDTSKAVDVLRRSLAVHPGNTILLNNLVFTLASDTNTAQEAIRLVPELLTAGRGDARVLDTVAMAYLRAGQLQEAEKVLADLGPLAQKSVRGLFRVGLLRAELQYRRGELPAALGTLDGILQRSAEVPTSDIVDASRLRQRALEEQKAAGPKADARRE